MPHAGGAFLPIPELFFPTNAALLTTKCNKDVKDILSRLFYSELSCFLLPHQVHGLLRTADPA